MVTVTNREPVVFRGVSAVCRSRGDRGEHYWKGLQRDFQPHWENGKNQILSWIELTRMDPVLKREKSRRLKTVVEVLKKLAPVQRGKGRLKTAAKPQPVIQLRSQQGQAGRQADDAEGEKVAIEKELRAQRSDKEQCVA